MNVLWEMGACERVLQGVLEGAKGLIHGVTCGAGMPYRLAEICARYGVYYYPIVSSARAFSALWKRAYHKFQDWLGAVVYEDPWLAGGHNGLSNSEDPSEPRGAVPARARAAQADARGRPRPRADRHGRRRLASRGLEGLDRQPGARADRVPVRHPAAADPARARSPRAGRSACSTLLPGDVLLHRFSPTGFYSRRSRTASSTSWSARSDRQVAFAEAPDPASGDDAFFAYGRSGHGVYLTADDHARVAGLGRRRASPSRCARPTTR